MQLICESRFFTNPTTVPVELFTSPASTSLLHFSIIRASMHSISRFSSPAVLVSSSLIFLSAASTFGINCLQTIVSSVSIASRQWTVLPVCSSIALSIAEHCKGWHQNQWWHSVFSEPTVRLWDLVYSCSSTCCNPPLIQQCTVLIRYHAHSYTF